MAIRKLVAILLPFAVMTVLGLSLGPPSQVRPLLPREPSSLDDPLPFQEGEQVAYEINWKPWFLLPSLVAGEVTMNLERATYQGTEVFKISAEAVSGGAFQALVGLDIRDHFESITDSRSFRSYRYRSEIRHGRRQRDLEVRIDYDRNLVRIREHDVAAQPHRQIRNVTHRDAPPYVSDTLSAFYAARLREMRLGETYLMDLSDNGKIRTVELKVVKDQEISIDLGKFDTLKISTVGGFFKDAGEFQIWYTRDALRIPVRFEADVRYGKIYGDLIRLQTPYMAKGRVRTK